MLVFTAAHGRAWLSRGILIAASMLASSAIAADIDPALLAGLKARSIGPAGMSGRIAAIDVAPNDRNTIYAGAATVPVQFSGLDRRCGMILIWTRDY